MFRNLLSFVVLVAWLVPAQAHFVFVVPAAEGRTVTVVFSDDLDPDEGVAMEKIAGLKLTAVYADGRTAPVGLKHEDHRFTGSIEGSPVLVHGSIVYGVMARANTPPVRLVYHPCAAFAVRTGDQDPAKANLEFQIVAENHSGKTTFQFLNRGKPVADAEGSVLLPDGTKQKVKTDKDGRTEAFATPGRYGIWLRHAEPGQGEIGGKTYTESRHYATLVVTVK